MKLRYVLFFLLAFATPTLAAAPQSIYDMDHVFKCTTIAKDWNGDRVHPKYDFVDGIYTDSKTSRIKRCTFTGADGEKWHPLFPSHTAENDESCRIAFEEQGKGNTISKFPVPASCLTYNEAANLMSANAPASANPELGQSVSFSTRIEMIRRAKKSIRIQYLIFFGDESGWAIAEELKKKRAEYPEKYPMDYEVEELRGKYKFPIQINVDALSNIANETNQRSRTQAMYFDLQQHGIEINGAGLTWVYLNEYYAANPLELDHRWHDKIFVVDAEDPDNGYAVVGGQNIANEYFRVGTYANGTPVFDHKIWRDQDVLLRGPVVRDVAKAFNNNFEHFSKLARNNSDAADPSKQTTLVGKAIAKVKSRAASAAGKVLGELPIITKMFDWDLLLKFLPDADPAKRPYFNTGKWSLVASVEKNCPKFFLGVDCQAKWVKVPGSHDRLEIEFYPYSNRYAGKAAINPENGQPFMNENIRDHVKRIYAELDKGSLIQKLHDQNRFHRAEMRWFNNHPRFGETYIMQAYTDAVRRAKSEIIISNAYFIPHGDKDVGLNEDFMMELKKAVIDRGVQVILMSNDVPDNDDPMITWNARWYYGDVLAWNDQAKTPRNGRKGHVDIYEWTGYKFHENTNHSKYGVFDAKEAIIGSFNLDHRSTGINSETVIALRSAPFAQEMVDQFKRNDLPKAKWVTPAQTAAWIKEMSESTDPQIRSLTIKKLRDPIEREN